MNRLFPWLLALLVLAGCTGVPPRGPLPVADPLQPPAEALATQGDYQAAAQLYLDAVPTAPANQHAYLRLQAAEYLGRGGLWEPLEALLAQLDTGTLSPEQQVGARLMRARMALALGQSALALEHLQTIARPQDLPDQGRDYYALRASAYSLAGNPLEAARQRIELDRLLRDPQQRLDNQYRIWEQLSMLGDPVLQELQTGADPALEGWMALTLAARQTRNNPQLWQQRLSEWRARFPGHAADAALLPDLASGGGQPGARPAHIAVLLPLSGRNAEAAAAIRDGIIAAYYADALERPELRFYDTAGDAALAWPLYQAAIADGAETVIGPLLKESIEQLARSGELAIPVLALNTTETPLPPGLPLYQFGLAPEDEAAQVAERMRGDAHRTAVALVPDSAWGERVESAFAERFSAGGGILLESARYAAGNADFKAPIQAVFNLDNSIARHRALQQRLGQNLHFEPRRRQDVDAIFILGTPEQARQIYPQLKFHHAGDLPVYGTSHLFSPAAQRDLDRDIDGLSFCDMPWILDTSGDWAEQRRRIAALWPERDQLYPRLFALGLDAYRVLPWLATLDRPGFDHFPGATGNLGLASGRRLRRDLEWAKIRKGRPVRLPPTPAPMSMEGPGYEPVQDTWRPR